MGSKRAATPSASVVLPSGSSFPVSVVFPSSAAVFSQIKAGSLPFGVVPLTVMGVGEGSGFFGWCGCLCWVMRAGLGTWSEWRFGSIGAASCTFLPWNSVVGSRRVQCFCEGVVGAKSMCEIGCGGGSCKRFGGLSSTLCRESTLFFYGFSCSLLIRYSLRGGCRGGILPPFPREEPGNEVGKAGIGGGRERKRVLFSRGLEGFCVRGNSRAVNRCSAVARTFCCGGVLVTGG